MLLPSYSEKSHIKIITNILLPEGLYVNIYPTLLAMSNIFIVSQPH